MTHVDHEEISVKQDEPYTAPYIIRREQSCPLWGLYLVHFAGFLISTFLHMLGRIDEQRFSRALCWEPSSLI